MGEEMNSVQVYVTSFGTVRLPDDFPSKHMRKDGLPDRRSKLAGALRDYIEDIEAGARKLWERGTPVGGLRVMDWSAWQSKKS